MLELPLCRIKIRFTFSFFAVVGLLSAAGRAIQINLAVVLICSLMHELGHITAMCLLGIPPESLTFYAGGIKLPETGLMCSKPKRAVILLSGCAVNLITAAVCLVLGCKSLFAAAHLALGTFNLLPFRFFDGGRLYSELTGREPPVLFKITALLPLVLLGTLSFIEGKPPVSLAAVTLLILLDG